MEAAQSKFGAFARILDACERFTSSRKRCFALSFALTFVAFAVATAAWHPTMINDDFSIGMALGSDWGGGEGLCLFLNAALAQAIYALNNALPFANWFVLLELATAYSAYLTMTYLALSRTPAPLAAVLFCGLTALALPGCSVLTNFTVVAFMASCAGCMLLGVSLHEQRHRVALVVLGLVFCAIGIMWRTMMFEVCIPLFGVAALIYTLSNEGRRHNMARSVARLWPYAAALLVLAAFTVYHDAVWQEEPWHDWREFNIARAQLSDYPNKSYGDIEAQLDEIGVSKNDYKMVNSWMTDDPDFFTTERMKAIAEVSAIDLMTPARIGPAVTEYFTNTLIDARLDLVLLLTLCLAAFTLQGRTRRTAFAMLAIALLLSLYFAVQGRLPWRVHYPIWLYAIAAICTDAIAPKPDAIANATERKMPPRIASNAIGVCSVGVSCLVALAAVAYSATLFSAERLEATFAPRTFQAQSSLLTYIDEHPDNTFICDVRAYSDVRYAYKLRGLPDHDTIMRACSIGGWTSHAPFSDRRNELAGTPNPIRDLVDNDAALFVWYTEDPPKNLLTYLKEHYYPNASYQLVDTVEDCVGYETLYIYKFTA